MSLASSCKHGICEIGKLGTPPKTGSLNYPIGQAVIPEFRPHFQYLDYSYTEKAMAMQQGTQLDLKIRLRRLIEQIDADYHIIIAGKAYKANNVVHDHARHCTEIQMKRVKEYDTG